MNITRGKIPSAKKIVLYGTEGIGKSTFASKFPDPIFIDTEDSTKELDVARFDKPTSWTMLLEQVKYVITNPGCCKTLIIDTADWAEQLEIAELCATKGWKGLEDAGYGKGYQYSAEEFGKLLNLLSEVTYKGISVVMTAHAWLRKVELPDEIGSYDHWEMKTSKKVAPLIREWADAVFFANYKTIVVNVDGQGAQKGKNKAQGGKRMLYTTHTPFWDAKNRLGLPDELPLDFAALAQYIGIPTAQAQTAPSPPPPPPQNPTETPPPDSDSAPAPAPQEAPKTQNNAAALKALEDLMKANNVAEYEVQAAFGARGYFPEDTPLENLPVDFIQGVLVGAWKQVFGWIQANRPILPF